MKTCVIINGKFSWYLIVDGHEISFQGSENADYFEAHYSELGYKVSRLEVLEEEPS